MRVAWFDASLGACYDLADSYDIDTTWGAGFFGLWRGVLGREGFFSFLGGWPSGKSCELLGKKRDWWVLSLRMPFSKKVLMDRKCWRRE